MGLSRQEYWSGLPCPPPGDLPDPGIKTTSVISSALIGRFFTTSATWEALFNITMLKALFSYPIFYLHLAGDNNLLEIYNKVAFFFFLVNARRKWVPNSPFLPHLYNFSLLLIHKWDKIGVSCAFKELYPVWSICRHKNSITMLETV